MAPLLLACIVVFLAVCYFLLKSKKARLPPGPKGVPIFGNVLQMDLNNFSTEMSRLGKGYKEAYTVGLFNQNVVIMNSFDMIKDAMMSHKYAQIFSGRPKTFVGEYVAKGDVGMTTYSKELASLRKIVFRGLKTYGSHLSEIEGLVQEELKHFIQRIEADAGTPVDPKDYVIGFVTNIVAMLLTGQRHRYDDTLLQLSYDVAMGMDTLLSPDVSALMTTLPWLRFTPYSGGKAYQKVQRDFSALQKMVFEELLNGPEKKQCFLEHILQERSNDTITDVNINGVLLDMISGGTGTSQNSLYSLMLTLASDKDVQKNIQEEIDRVIGSNRLPCAEDKHNMPYTHATILELLRLYPAGPMALPHSTTEDVEFRDYYFPKNTVVFYSIWNVLHDESFWDEAWTFKPTRFLDEEGNLVSSEDEKRKRLIAFGIGKRQCVGEVLARLRIFMAIVAILQKFTLLPDPDYPLPKADPRTFAAHLFLTAPKYKIVFEPRVAE